MHAYCSSVLSAVLTEFDFNTGFLKPIFFLGKRVLFWVNDPLYNQGFSFLMGWCKQILVVVLSVNVMIPC